MKCHNCAAELNLDAKFCGNCGVAVANWICQKCQHENPPTNKFCSNCGNAHESTTTDKESLPDNGFKEAQGERKFLTVLFADVKGSTALIFDRDPEETRALLEPVLKILLDSVEEFGGTVIKSAGDGIMALFGAPIALEHHVLRASYAALAMQKRIADLHNDISIRVGLNAGEVVVDVIGSGSRREYDALGPTVNLAARLEQTARPGTIQMSADTYALVQDKIQASSLGKKHLKGFKDSIHIYLLQSILYDYSDLQKKKLSPFIGRETEQLLFKHKLELVKVGRGQILALKGNPGVGKSRLIFEFFNSPDAHDYKKLDGHGFLIRKNVPFYSAKQLFKNIFSLKNEAYEDNKKILDALLNTQLQSFKSQKNALYSLADIPEQDEKWLSFSPQLKRVEMMDTLIQILVEQSHPEGLILAIDDVQWLDNETLFFLERFFNAIKNEKIMLLLAYRTEFEPPWHLGSLLTEIPVDSLGTKGTEELENAILGTDPSLEKLKGQLTQISEGNPFFLEEMILSLYQNDILSGKPGHYKLNKLEDTIVLPHSIQAVMASRVDTLSKDQKKVLLYSSVIGKSILVSLLTSIIDIHGKKLEEILKILTQKEFLLEVQKEPEEYGFVNNLTLEVLYNSLLKEAKKQIHLHVLEQLEMIYPEESIQTDLKAMHALRGESWLKALKYNAILGNEAFDLSAPLDAATYLNRVFEAYDHLTPNPEINAIFIGCRYRKFHVLIWLDRFKDLEYILKKPIEIATAENNINLKTTLILSSVVTNGLVQGDYQKGVQCYEETLKIAQELKDDNLIASTLFYGIQPLGLLGQYRKCIQCFDRLYQLRGENLERDLTTGDPLLPISTMYACISATELGDLEVIKRLEDFLLKIVAILTPSLESIVFNAALATINFYYGDFSKSINYFQTAQKSVEKTLLHVADVPIFLNLGFLFALDKKFDQSEKYLDQASEIATKYQFFFTAGHFVNYLAEGYLISNRLGKAKASLEKCFSLARNQKQKALEAQALRIKAELMMVEDTKSTKNIEEFFTRSLEISKELELLPNIAHNYRGLFKLYKKIGDEKKALEHFEKALEIYKNIQMSFWVKYMEELKD